MAIVAAVTKARRFKINREASVEFSLRQLPVIPDSLVKKFPDLQKYNEDIKRWCDDTQNMMRSILSLKMDPPQQSAASTTQAPQQASVSVLSSTQVTNGLPAGGSHGQALVKAGSVDFAATWQTLTNPVAVASSTASLKAIPSNHNYSAAVVVSDLVGGGSLYKWTPGDSTSVDDGESILRPNDLGPGRWFLVLWPTGFWTNWVQTTSVSTAWPDGCGVLLADSTSGTITVTLPDPASCKRSIIIKKVDSSVNPVNVSQFGTELIDGSAIVGLASQWDAYMLATNGTDWFLI